MGAGRIAEVNVFGADNAIAGQRRGGLQGIPEFSHVSWIPVFCEPRNRLGGQHAKSGYPPLASREASWR